MHVKDVLIEAKGLIADERKWTRRSFFQNGKRCAYGALSVAKRGYPIAECEALAEAMGSPKRGVDATYIVWHFNDNNGHQQVMKLFDTAIQIASNQTPT